MRRKKAPPIPERSLEELFVSRGEISESGVYEVTYQFDTPEERDYLLFAFSFSPTMLLSTGRFIVTFRTVPNVFPMVDASGRLVSLPLAEPAGDYRMECI